MAKTLFDHATFELRKLGLHLESNPDSRKILVDTLALVKRFEKQDHNEYTGKWVLEFVDTLCNFMPLSPITDDPEEWEGYEDSHKNMKTGETVVTKRWQNLRQPSIISMDAGKTFVDLRTNKEGESVDHIKQAEDWAADRAKREAAAKAAKENEGKPTEQAPNVLAQPPVDTSVPAGEEASAAQTPAPTKEETDKANANQTQAEEK